MRHLLRLLALASAGFLCLASAAPMEAARIAPVPGADAVRVGTNDAPPGSTEIGPIEGIHGDGDVCSGAHGSFEGAYAAFKNQATARGASYVKIVHTTIPHVRDGCYVNAFVIRGIAYREPTAATDVPAVHTLTASSD